MLVSVLAAFFASGFAALLYQIVWQRMLGIFSGADVQSATIVIAAFMACLGSSSLGGGHLADRVSRRTSLVLFGVAELAVATFGVWSSTLFYGVLYERVGRLGLGIAPTAAILFAALIVPTFCMGMSLPLLARGVTRHVDRAASTVGWLYGINTLGAALGALCATWWFLPQAGLSGSLKVAAGLNLVCAAIALSLVVRQWGESAVHITVPAGADAAAAASTRTATADAIGERALPLQVWAALFGLSGFVALSLEIVWFRLLGIMLKSTAFTFGTVLGLYLTGIGLGAALGSAAARRVRRPAFWFLVLQAGIGAYAALSLTLLIARLNTWPLLHWFADYVGPHEPLDIRSVVTHVQHAVTSRGELASGLRGLPWQFVRLYVLLPAALVGPPTLMAGFGFPLLQRVVQVDLAQLGRRVGVMLSANILGSTLGAFIAGWVFLDVLGTAGTLKLRLLGRICG
jgi:spermidine synthase